MVLVESCSTKGCQGMSIDGLDGRCEWCLTPKLKTYKVVGSITEFIEAFDDVEAMEKFEDKHIDIEFGDLAVDEEDE